MMHTGLGCEWERCGMMSVHESLQLTEGVSLARVGDGRVVLVFSPRDEDQASTFDAWDDKNCGGMVVLVLAFVNVLASRNGLMENGMVVDFMESGLLRVAAVGGA